MANTAMYDRIIEKIKQHPLRPEEIEALRRGRENLKRHVFLGTMAGTVAGIMFSRRRKFRPLQSMLMGGFTALIGMQFGVATGTWSAMREIRQLPDPSHLLELFRKIQDEMIRDRMFGRQTTGVLEQPAPVLRDTPTSRRDGATDDWQRPIETTESTQPVSGEGATTMRPKSRWDEIREQRASSSWERLRSRVLKEEDASNTASNTTWNGETSTGMSAEGFARTREDFERLRGQKVRRNQYGDIIEE